MTLSDKEVSNELSALALTLTKIKETAEDRSWYWTKNKTPSPVIKNDGWKLGHMDVSGYLELDSALACLASAKEEMTKLAKEKERLADYIDSI